MCVQGLSDVLGQSSPHQNKGKKIHISMAANSFRGTAPRSPNHNPLDFYLCRHLKTLLGSPPIINEATIQWRISGIYQTMLNCHETLEGCESP